MSALSGVLCPVPSPTQEVIGSTCRTQFPACLRAYFDDVPCAGHIRIEKSAVIVFHTNRCRSGRHRAKTTGALITVDRSRWSVEVVLSVTSDHCVGKCGFRSRNSNLCLRVRSDAYDAETACQNNRIQWSHCSFSFFAVQRAADNPDVNRDPISRHTARSIVSDKNFTCPSPYRTLTPPACKLVAG